MSVTRTVRAAAAGIVISLLWPLPGAGAGQGRLAAVKSLRCSFPQNATGVWRADGTPDAALKPATLVLRFAAIDADVGTAELRTGSAASEITVKLEGAYLHFMQSFRTGPLYTTTVFDSGTGNGPFKAVHSRHEYFSVPLPGATSSPEQYYGQCEAN
jgi:hypothetical protein